MRYIKTTLFLSYLYVILPTLAFAQGSIGGNPSNPGNIGSNPSNPGSIGGNPPASNGEVSLMNPLGNKTLMEFIQDILDVILVFAVPLIVFFIILAGFNFVMARGNDGKLESAKKALLYAIIGGVIILGAYVILEVISGTIDAFR